MHDFVIGAGIDCAACKEPRDSRLHRVTYKANLGTIENVADLAAAIGKEFEMVNEARAQRGAVAFVAYVAKAGEDELQTSFTDMLADLLHLSDAIGVDFDEAVRVAHNHHDRELEGTL
jgi:hypothetical protein